MIKKKWRFKYKMLLEGEKLTPSTEIKRFSNRDEPGESREAWDYKKSV